VRVRVRVGVRVRVIESHRLDHAVNLVGARVDEDAHSERPARLVRVKVRVRVSVGVGVGVRVRVGGRVR